jgi:hypothetical protein
MSPGGTVMTFGRSKAKIYGENEVKVTFKFKGGSVKGSVKWEGKELLFSILHKLRNTSPLVCRTCDGRIGHGGTSTHRKHQTHEQQIRMICACLSYHSL